MGTLLKRSGYFGVSSSIARMVSGTCIALPVQFSVSSRNRLIEPLYSSQDRCESEDVYFEPAF
jgi:hypothetical protein